MGRLRTLVGLVVITLLGMLTGVGARVLPDPAANAASRPATTSSAREAAAYERLPLAFEPNVGQAPAGVDFVAHGPGYALALQGGSALLSVQAGAKVPEHPGHPPSGRANPASAAGGRASRVVRLALVGADPHAVGQRQRALPGVASYLLGNDPTHWRANVPTYARVRYADVYPGVAIEYYGRQGQLEEDFAVAPGADPNRISFAVRGAGALTSMPDGALQLSVDDGALRLEPPSLYQDSPTGRVHVAGGYRLNADGTTGFDVGDYDASRPLIIDPVLAYSTDLGGSGNDYGNGIALDSSGDAYVTGSTTSSDFPTTAGAFEATGRGGPNAFVAKLNATGTALVYSTYLGGSGSDFGYGIAVDGAGDAYVTGATNSTDFPITPGAAQPTYGGDTNGTYGDAFVAELNPGGTALVSGTYLGGSGSDGGAGIAVDGAGAAYVTGWTDSADFPTTPGALRATYGGDEDAFVAKLDPGGAALAFSTYLGGAGSDAGAGIAVDSRGDAFATGYTTSAAFPTTPGAVQPALVGGSCGYGLEICPDAFVAALNPAGTALVYGTYLGGGGSDYGTGIALDSSGNAYVTGSTTSPDFPTTPGAAQPTYGGDDATLIGDAFVAKLDAAGTALAYSTYLGGSGGDGGAGIATDSLGDAYVTGGTTSADFPTTPGAVQATFVSAPSGSHFSPCSFTPCPDAFATKLDPAGAAVAYSTYLGGSLVDGGAGIAADGAGDVYVTGETASADFPTTAGPAFGGGTDAFVAKLALSAVGPTVGGTNLALTAAAPGATTLTWQTGDVQTGYDLLRLSDTGDVVLGPLPASATRYVDSPPSVDRIDCYADLPLDGTAALGVSDLLCRVPGVQAGAPPGNFAIRLDQAYTATMAWTPPPGGQPASGYILASLDLARPGAQWATTSLPGSATGDAVDVGADFTCFVLIAQTSTTAFANTDLLCADPGVATLAAGPTAGPQATTQQAHASVTQRVRAAITHVPTRQRVRAEVQQAVAHRADMSGPTSRPR